MKTIPLRDFQREGTKALGAGTAHGPWLLAGRDQEFVLLPMTPENRSFVMDLADGLSAIMALRQDQESAVEAGLDRLTMQEIDAEIRDTRKAMKGRKRSA